MTGCTLQSPAVTEITRDRLAEVRESRKTRCEASTHMQIVRAHEDGGFDTDRLASILLSILQEPRA